ncbi:MAG TPA: peptide chain release factor N(5)-glutamine methyltransferase [Tepidisphaeraceae bacterium]|jgi:release factor glutamine methyltransferase|nr:peptide chain release factor N(5)-glutamine methyltransferase [Tepidisphaeraceae bacterium]
MADGGTWTVRRLLEWTTGYFTRKNVDQPRLAAELLLGHVLNYPRIKLYTDYERVLTDAQLAVFRPLVQRAAEDEPIAYLTGKAHFFNLEFDVTRDVLIPRPDTETLVENVMQFVRNQAGMEAPRVLDLCTGSGCIAAAVAHHIKSAVVTATEISPAAAAIARKNIDRLGLTGRVLIEEGDLFKPLNHMVDVRPFDLILSNPPYIPTSQIASLDRSVKDYEPLQALDGGLDGLMLHRRILDQAPDRLVPGGRVFLEIAFDQGELATKVAQEYPAFEDVRVLKDYGGRDRVLTARRK